MKRDALSVASLALETNHTDSSVSLYIKNFFDNKYGPTWHCIVGSDFKCFCSYESKYFIFFYIGKTAICLFRTSAWTKMYKEVSAILYDKWIILLVYEYCIWIIYDTSN